jgi:hypothetical protein
MASVSISNIETGMTLGTTFTAYGNFDTRNSFYSGSTMVRCSIQVGGGTYSATITESYDSTLLQGYWQGEFTGLPTGTGAVLKAKLVVPDPPPDAQVSNLTISDSAGLGSPLTVAPPPPPPPPPPAPPAPPAAPAPRAKAVAAAAHKVKPSFTIGGTYTPGPLDIVIVSIRKNGKLCGESRNHRLAPGTKKWEDDVQANAGEIGDGYSIVAELQHNAKRIATASLPGVKIET